MKVTFDYLLVAAGVWPDGGVGDYGKELAKIEASKASKKIKNKANGLDSITYHDAATMTNKLIMNEAQTGTDVEMLVEKDSNEKIDLNSTPNKALNNDSRLLDSTFGSNLAVSESNLENLISLVQAEKLVENDSNTHILGISIDEMCDEK